MTDTITEAAKAAGGTTYTNRYYPGETACAFGPEALARFYAIAYRAGLEDAAKVCEKEHQRAKLNMDVDVAANHQFWNGGAIFADQLAEEIRALKETP